MYDVAIIGGGPSGLSAAVGASSEGLDTVVLYASLGGQAGSSSLIENFLGFPQGISGPALTDRAKRQALKFGTTFLPCWVKSIERVPGGFFILTDKGSIVRARSVIIASGARYNRLDEDTRFSEYEGRGVHYACTPQSVSRRCQCEDVVVVGAGNSAGQAATYLSTKAKHVHLLVRGDTLHSTMSEYLIRRIEESPDISVHYKTEVVRFDGDRWLDSVTWATEGTVSTPHRISDAYVMIGASPNCGFASSICELDDHGFVKTNPKFETNMPGIYAVGDVRSGSVKRCANAVGEGATSIKGLWKYLTEDSNA